jgi:mannose-6-phosphate isomerase-like protein (cupin superfamily)
MRMNHVLKPPIKPTFNRVGVIGSIFSTQHLTNKTEFLIIATEAGHDTTIIEHECDFSYFILEGSGEFIINGKTESCSVGNLVVIPAGNQFTYKGKLKMLLNVTPPFTPAQEETLTNT